LAFPHLLDLSFLRNSGQVWGIVMRREFASDGDSVTYEGIEYRWLNGNWCYAQSDLIVPLHVAHKLDMAFAPLRKYPPGQHSGIPQEPTGRRGPEVQGGLPTLGKKR
jgi:hypothetical protein